MIEFKGSYFQSSTSKALSVLVQYDGAEIHIWHALDPFFRLAAYDEFRIHKKRGVYQCSISLPNGDRIETNDADASQLNRRVFFSENPKSQWKSIAPWFFTLIFLVVCSILGFWMLSMN